jgi:hypothetical protein
MVAVELVHCLDREEPIIAMRGSLKFLKNPSLQDTAQYLKKLILQDTGLNLVPEEPFLNKALLGSPEIRKMYKRIGYTENFFLSHCRLSSLNLRFGNSFTNEKLKMMSCCVSSCSIISPNNK